MIPSSMATRCGRTTLGATLGLLLSSPAQAALLTVTNTDDAGPGSLRQAVLDAATTGDTIVFAPALAGQTITLTTQDPQAQITDPIANVPAPFGPTGIVVNGKTLTIDGAAAPGIAISGGNLQRILAVTGAGGRGAPLPATTGALTCATSPCATASPKAVTGRMRHRVREAEPWDWAAQCSSTPQRPCISIVAC